jgi:SAM-dependent methyltransferase
MREAFSAIYRGAGWGASESVSGPGSGIARTALIRQDLDALIRELGAESMLDAGCGDFHWMKEASLPTVCRYIGVDVVPELILRNRTRYERPGRGFLAADITRDRLPRADLILCRDCLVHLPLADVRRALVNFRRSGAGYLLATTFITRMENPEITLGWWRPLNLERAPFGLPEPIRLIDERCPPDRVEYADKRLALWRLDAMRLR